MQEPSLQQDCPEPPQATQRSAVVAQAVPGAEQNWRPLIAPLPSPRQQVWARPPQALPPMPHDPSALQLPLARCRQLVPTPMHTPSALRQAPAAQLLPAQAGCPTPPQGEQVPTPSPAQTSAPVQLRRAQHGWLMPPHSRHTPFTQLLLAARHGAPPLPGQQDCPALPQATAGPSPLTR